MSSTGCGREKVASVSGMSLRRAPEHGDQPSLPGMAGAAAEGSPTARPGRQPPTPAESVDVRRSARRRRTVSAYRDGDRTVVLIPARMSRAEERRWVSVMLERLDRQDARLRPSDDTLMARANDLSRRFLDGRARPASVRWVTNQGSRWGSCTPVDASIRLSTRLQGMPSWVVDYVLVHELAHLLVPGHGRDFWALVDRFPRTERARGYLEGVSATAGLGLSDEADETSDDADDADESDGFLDADDVVGPEAGADR